MSYMRKEGPSPPPFFFLPRKQRRTAALSLPLVAALLAPSVRPSVRLTRTAVPSVCWWMRRRRRRRRRRRWRRERRYRRRSTTDKQAGWARVEGNVCPLRGGWGRWVGWGSGREYFSSNFECEDDVDKEEEGFAAAGAAVTRRRKKK